MTLVQNHQRQLNGNSLIIFLVIISIGFSSCEAFKKAQGDNPVVKDDKGESIVDTPKLKAKMQKIGTILADCFRGISEFFVFTSVNLAEFIDLLPTREW